MKAYEVIAELVDIRDGSRHYPPNPFTPADDDHAARLIAAGCLAKEPMKNQPKQIDPGPAGLTVDGLDGLSAKELHAKGAELKIDLGKLTRKADMLKAIRDELAKREADANVDDDGLETSTDDHLLEVVEAEGIDVGEATERDEIIAAIRAARQAK